MTIIYKDTNKIVLPKIDTCLLGECNLYQLILQSTFTNEIFVFKLRDYSQGHLLRHCFNFVVPDCMQYGEYNLYLIKASEWGVEEIDKFYPAYTYRQTDKGAIMSCGKYIITNGRMLVTSSKKVLITDSSGYVNVDKGISFFATDYSEDIREEGELYEDLKIIYRGLLKYKRGEFEEESPYTEPTSKMKNNKYKSYNGRRRG